MGNLLLDKITGKLGDQDKAIQAATERENFAKAEWQKQVDTVVELLKSIGVEDITAPTFALGASHTAILFKVGECPGSFVLVGPYFLTLSIGNRPIGQFRAADAPESGIPLATIEEVSEALATAIVAYSQEQGIEFTTPTAPKRGRKPNDAQQA
jgi:hypothetical protein